MRRYEGARTMLTSNRPVEEWGKLLGDVAAVSAMLDHPLHAATYSSAARGAGEKRLMQIRPAFMRRSRALLAEAWLDIGRDVQTRSIACGARLDAVEQ